jgi:hypothetical protein
MIKFGSRYRCWFPPALFTAGILVAFRGWLFSGFDGIFGAQEDDFLAIALIEHWHHVFSEEVNWSDPIFFYPERGVLGYSTAFLLFGLAEIPVRLLGIDAFTAYMLALVALAAAGFFCFYKFSIHYFSMPPAWAAIGAFLFAFANLDVVKFVHVQSYCAMLLPGICLLFLSGWNRNNGVLLCGAAGLLYGALMLTSFETAWFLACFLLLLFLLYAPIFGLTAIRQLVWQITTVNRPKVLATLCAVGIGIVPFLALYLPIFAKHTREFAEVVSNLPDWSDLGNVTPENALWGTLLDRWDIAGRDGPYWEVELGFTPGVLIIFISTVVALTAAAYMRRSFPGRDRYFILFGAAVMIFWLLQMDYFGVRPWHVIWESVPAGKAIRYPFRSQLVSNFFVALVVARGLAGIAGGFLVPALLSCLLLVEQINSVWPPIFSRQATLAWINSVPAAPDGCRSFYLMPGPAENRNNWQRQDDAALFSEIRNIPTINGDSSWLPDRWNLSEPESANYPEAVREWARDHQIEGLCGLEPRSGKWSVGLP